ncbi:acyl-CoA dehydrogenase family protein [Actinocrinis sp.]|uniref:acyl-CoA dehydrogenase family protein n=1 Tax=Actinocrinis sp. TaxID=1920516 RepID=UPI002C30A893|nr:acyl-CoA dehydrogenase family protein [Actinocrinis sp.]HXR71195.1 acyl-CoA dehydrogenase family protein [Actinocrinis sp.]
MLSEATAADRPGTALLDQEADASARATEIEFGFGDPYDPDNPVGNARLLEADEAAEISAEGERMLDELKLNADFVPREFGGRLDRLDTLVRVMRQVFRRDVTLGLGYGATSFMAAVNVWTVGSEEQKRELAELLLAGGKASVAYHELAHGNDFVRNEFEARPVDGGGFRLDGGKQVINNADRAEALALFSRTSTAPGSRSHSVLLLRRDQLDPKRFKTLPRYTAVGVRGCHLSGLEFDDCPVPGSALVGGLGQGVELALRSFQITRSAVPGMAIGTGDASLRTAVRFAVGRQLYRRSVMEIPHAKATLSAAFLDLLICDAMSLAGTRAVHLLPEETSVYASAVKYLVPKVLSEAMYELSIVLGARFYVRDGEFGIFQKHVRDLPVLSLGHAGSAACQATIIPQLSRLAKRAWFAGEPAPAELFQPRAPLGPIPFDRLTLASGRDGLSASLIAAVDELPSGSPVERALHGFALRMMDELRQMQEEALDLSPQDRTALASPASFALADRYTVLLAAASVLGVWREARGGSDEFLADPSWAATALYRLARRLGQKLPDLPDSCAERVHDEVLRRFHEHRSYDLYDSPLTA